MFYECQYSYFPPLKNFNETWKHLILVTNERITRKLGVGWEKGRHFPREVCLTFAEIFFYWGCSWVHETHKHMWQDIHSAPHCFHSHQTITCKCTYFSSGLILWDWSSLIYLLQRVPSKTGCLDNKSCYEVWWATVTWLNTFYITLRTKGTKGFCFLVLLFVVSSNGPRV